MSKNRSSRVPDPITLGRATQPLVDRDYPHFNKKKVVFFVVAGLVVLLALLLLLWPGALPLG